VLLFSMMVLVAHLHLAGFFDWITESVVAAIYPRHLLPTVIFLSGVLSAFFVNDHLPGDGSFRADGGAADGTAAAPLPAGRGHRL
jgi:hypothetical protein